MTNYIIYLSESVGDSVFLLICSSDWNIPQSLKYHLAHSKTKPSKWDDDLIWHSC